MEPCVFLSIMDLSRMILSFQYILDKICIASICKPNLLTPSFTCCRIVPSIHMAAHDSIRGTHIMHGQTCWDNFAYFLQGVSAKMPQRSGPTTFQPLSLRTVRSSRQSCSNLHDARILAVVLIRPSRQGVSSWAFFLCCKQILWAIFESKFNFREQFLCAICYV